MSLLKTPEEIEILKGAGNRLARVLDEVCKHVKPGVTTKELDALGEKLIQEGGDVPAFKNYTPEGAKTPFPATICISVNDAVVHGIPDDYALQEGDIVGLDIGLVRDGKYIVDMARTLPVGKISTEEKMLLETTKRSLFAGIKAALPGNKIGAIGSAIEEVARAGGYGVVEVLGGHGVGHAVHEEPFIPNFGSKNSGIEIQEGMVLALEPMLNLGTQNVRLDRDGYTYRTKDGKKSAHFEHTIAITKSGPVILTE